MIISYLRSSPTIASPTIVSHPKFGISITGCHIDVVDPGFQKRFQNPVGPILPHGAQSCGSEDDQGALVPGFPKGKFTLFEISNSKLDYMDSCVCKNNREYACCESNFLTKKIMKHKSPKD